MTATFLAGIMLVIAAVLKVGTYVKYVPGPVILGFTSGIGVLIAIGQVKDFLGLKGDMPADVVPKLTALWEARDSFNPSAPSRSASRRSPSSSPASAGGRSGRAC